MCGGNRLVSVQEIKESEKRLKIKSLLKLHSSSIAISVKEYLFEFCGSPDNTKISEEDQLIATFPYNQVQFDETQLPVLLYVAGYAAKKTSAKINCISCKQLLVDESCEKLEVDIDKSIIAYFEELNRGGLTYPSSTLLHAFQASHAIFNICISEDFEKVFLKLSNPKYFLLQANLHYWENFDLFSSITTCSLCLKQNSTILIQCVSVLANIMLNNYSKAKSDNIRYTAVIAKRAAKF